jgi:hypothetical protein
LFVCFVFQAIKNHREQFSGEPINRVIWSKYPTVVRLRSMKQGIIKAMLKTYGWIK